MLDTDNRYNTSEPHRHSYFEIFFFTKGGGKHSIDFQEVDINDNAVHVVIPGQVHELSLLPSTTGCFISFNALSLHHFLQADKIDKLELLKWHNQNAILTSNTEEMNGFVKSAMAINESDNLDLKFAWLNLLLVQLNDLFLQENPLHLVIATDDTIKKFKWLLEQHYFQQHSPSFYAERLCISEKILNRKIKRIVGLTVLQFISQRILLEAKRLILNSQVSFKEISFELGFHDPAYFTRFIKKNTKLAPSALRKSKKYK